MTVLLAGLCTIDVVQRVAELPEPGEKVQSLSVDVAAGGPATNAAVTVAALGGHARLLTVLGAHPLADLARADLSAYGVDFVDVAPSFVDPPALSAVAVRDRDGERTVVSRNAAHSPTVTGTPWEADEVRAVLVDGHHPELALGTARWARSRGVPVVLDAGSWKPVLDELLPLVDIAACSAHFRAPAPDLLDRGVAAVITTAGPEPVRWRTATEAGEVPVPAADARDTLGAGDVWHGALAYGVGRFELPELIRFANEVAAQRVRHIGPRAWVREMGVR
ncbi:PfkB family carbohydrate kinase [Amycolatopsis acidiphila]|uniref:Ribokinase n=1 Tax=Amycolatopsis acidiphila TaxID=715473 RepID=A0A558AGT3_9PSEU|nr:PfkB family carbohydrate kinase [Amycolatopsis acidiphila]TVT23478.1 ribokinase [Amycolatopsis acidiphila]UIJ59937.1 PfkB family carbohydrate kinase [Amycolatopsis acidiphila]GHG62330.1 ribokinase [Amycolatopsis acidiphila]